MHLGCSKDEHFSCFLIPCRTGLRRFFCPVFKRDHPVHYYGVLEHSMNYFHFKDNWLGVWPGSKEFNFYLEMIHLPTSLFFIHLIIISGLTHFLSQLFMEIWILLKLSFVIHKCMKLICSHLWCVQNLLYIHTILQCAAPDSSRKQKFPCCSYQNWGETILHYNFYPSEKKNP